VVVVVSSGVSGLELDKKFKRCLIRTGLETLNHLFPDILEPVGAATAWFIAEPSYRFRTDDDAACPGILAPTIDTPEKSSVLLATKASRELHAQLFEELTGVDVRESF
jgi:hypothetical protein